MEYCLLYDHHLQLCLLDNVVVNAVSDKKVDKDNVGGVDERNVLKVITWHTSNLAPLYCLLPHFILNREARKLPASPEAKGICPPCEAT